MLRTVPLSIIRSFFYCTHSNGICHTGLLTACEQDQDGTSWWWSEELSETCRVLFQEWIWEISASSWFYYENLSWCTVTWTSNDVAVRFSYIRKESGLKRDSGYRKDTIHLHPLQLPHPTPPQPHPFCYSSHFDLALRALRAIITKFLCHYAPPPFLFIFVFQLPHHFRIHTFTVNMCNVSKYLFFFLS